MFDQKQKSVSSSHTLSAITMIFLGGIYFLATSGWVGWRTVGLILTIVPVMWAIHCGWRAYQAAGKLTGRVISHLLWSLFPFLIFSLWSVGFDIGNLWPLGAVFVGLTMLINQKGHNDGH
jgi:hypothetical protein